MTVHVTIDGLTRLRRINPDDAELCRALCVLLANAGLDASQARTEPGSMWFSAGNMTQFHIRRIDGRPVLLSAARLSDAVASLDHADPLLTRVEAALGIAMDADAIVADAPNDAVCIAVQSGDDEIHLGIARAHPRRATWIAHAAVAPPLGSMMPCLVQLEAIGPRLDMVEASHLGDGDLLLIPNRMPATLVAAHVAPVPGMIDLITGNFSAGQTGDTMSEEAPTPDFMVPLSIRLPDRMTSAASLSTLVPGTTLALGPLTEGMAVELRVGARLLARGELVQLGDQFAVLIEAREDIANPLAADAS